MTRLPFDPNHDELREAMRLGGGLALVNVCEAALDRFEATIDLNHPVHDLVENADEVQRHVIASDDHLHVDESLSETPVLIVERHLRRVALAKLRNILDQALAS